MGCRTPGDTPSTFVDFYRLNVALFDNGRTRQTDDAQNGGPAGSVAKDGIEGPLTVGGKTRPHCLLGAGGVVILISELATVSATMSMVSFRRPGELTWPDSPNATPPLEEAARMFEAIGADLIGGEAAVDSGRAWARAGDARRATRMHQRSRQLLDRWPGCQLACPAGPQYPRPADRSGEGRWHCSRLPGSVTRRLRSGYSFRSAPSTTTSNMYMRSLASNREPSWGTSSARLGPGVRSGHYRRAR
jgi:hypothetical protein